MKREFPFSVRPLWIGVALAAVVLIGSGIWFWSLGSPRPEDQGTSVHLAEVRGTVEVQSASSTDWRAATEGEEVQVGETLRTGDSSSANIEWGDRGESRLEAQTQLTVSAIPNDPLATSQVVIRLRLSSGRVWSRLLKVFDLQSVFSVETNGVVATTRGTTFGVEASSSGTRVAVTESVVAVSVGTASSSTLVRDNQMTTVTAKRTASGVQIIPLDDTWVQQNTLKDAAYDAALRTSIRARFNARIPQAPEFLVEWSEQLHLAFAPRSAQDEVRLTMFEYQLARLLQDPSHVDQMPNTNGWEYGNLVGDTSIAQALRSVRFAIFLTAPGSGAAATPSIVDVLRRVRGDLLVQAAAADGMSSTEATSYAGALDLDDRIDALAASFQLQPDDVRQVEQGIDVWISQLKNEEGNSEKFRAKIEALQYRVAGFDSLFSSSTGMATSTPSSGPDLQNLSASTSQIQLWHDTPFTKTSPSSTTSTAESASATTTSSTKMDVGPGRQNITQGS